MEVRKTKICPKCKIAYPNIPEIQHCICGHKFESILRDFGEDVLKGFDIREGLDRK